jgi:2'-5' RNA ligase
MTSPGSVGVGEHLRLFLALRLPDAVLDALDRWSEDHLAGGRRVGRGDLHVTLDDRGGRSVELAERVHDRLDRLGVYRREARPWLPHVTALRFRTRPRLQPPLPEIGPFAPSDAAAFLSRLHPAGARYEVLESVPLGG